ncbi:MAG TPA: branched-chain amino acid ABC transporter permease [Stellaceae bacterium]|nr:branched-chain amino acid ABC transporter permease [Stellaceae bacterium]
MFNILVYGAVTSAVYAMLAVGFTLIFGVARILNLSHGAFYGLGAYAAYVLTAKLHWPLLPAAVFSVLFVAAFGALVERFLVRPLRASALAVLMITLAVALLFEQGMFILFGSEARNVPAFSTATWTYSGLDISGQRLLTLAAGFVVLGVLYIFIQRTRLGSAILAISQDPEGAQYMGIPANRMYSLVMALSAGIAATAGVLTAPFLTVQPTMDLLPMVKAFAIVIVGGLGSIPGSILAALLLGYSETIVAYTISPAWTEIVSLIAVLLTLILRPAGLLGTRAAF